MKLLLASGNTKKRRELTELLAHLGVELLGPEDVGGLPEVDEDQDTFEGNARKKAISGARSKGLWCLADDSGLAVDALGGAPGVHSARYAGTHGDDEGNNDKLLRELRGLPPEQRGARFICVLALCDPAGEVVEECRGEVRGRILEERQGTGGFGYDPLFLFTEPGFPQSDRCFGILEAYEKAHVSHRGRALRELIERLPNWLSRA